MMCAWLQATAESVGPLAALTAEGVRLSRAVHADETVEPVWSPGTGWLRAGTIETDLDDRQNPDIAHHPGP